MCAATVSVCGPNDPSWLCDEEAGVWIVRDGDGLGSRPCLCPGDCFVAFCDRNRLNNTQSRESPYLDIYRKKFDKEVPNAVLSKVWTAVPR